MEKRERKKAQLRFSKRGYSKRTLEGEEKEPQRQENRHFGSKSQGWKKITIK